MAEEKKKKTEAPMAPSGGIAPEPQTIGKTESFSSGIKDFITNFLKNTGLDKIIDKIKEALGMEAKSKPETHGGKPEKSPGAETSAKPAEPGASPKPSPEVAPSQRPVAAPAPAETASNPKIVEVEVKDPDLKKFYDSLSPEQVEMQKRIAELGGSESLGEPKGIEPGLPASIYTLEKNLGAEKYDGPFYSKDVKRFQYEPSEEVNRLAKEFEESLTPDQKALFNKYSDKAHRELREGYDRGMNPYTAPVLRTGQTDEFSKLLRENMSEVTSPSTGFKQGGPSVTVEPGIKTIMSGP
ncbi:MAG: hypothetical protein RBR86_09460 [Pseudobdellovibrionaceae bacterium]|jgi:hypothetical protein|nr:hypothetical protein [Pseudobdellovibrionaceae bacterium]